MLRIWRKAEKCVDLAVGIKLHRLDRGGHNPMDVLGRIEPYIGDYRTQE